MRRSRGWLVGDYPRSSPCQGGGRRDPWGDETGISNQANYGRSFAPEGRTPVIARTAKRHTTSMISTVTNRGTARFMIYAGALNTALFLGFLKRLVRGAGSKIFLVVDNLKVHHANRIKAWVADHQEEIELLPAALRARAQPGRVPRTTTSSRASAARRCRRTSPASKEPAPLHAPAPTPTAEDPSLLSGADHGLRRLIPIFARLVSNQSLELWKHYAGFGGEDKNRMVTLASWLLAGSAGTAWYIVTTLAEQKSSNRQAFDNGSRFCDWM